MNFSGQCPRCGYPSPKILNILIIGAGSAGQRHARMLRERGHRCEFYDPPAGYGWQWKEHPDAVVIASPPETHEKYLKEWWDKCPILCEGPVTWRPGIERSPRSYPHMTASNWLFVPQIQHLYTKIRTTHLEPVSAHLWFDYDLAKWRPNWDYRTSCYYESGIDLINCHEAMTALWLFGPVEETHALWRTTGKSKGIDAISIVSKHASGVLVTINSGWHAAAYQRGIRVVFKDGTVEQIGWSSPADDAICNQSYAAMIDHWLLAIETNNVDVRPSLLDGYWAYKLMQGEAV